MEKMIKVARYRNTPYVVNYQFSNGNEKAYHWTGSTKSKTDIKEVPQQLVDYLLMSSQTFRDGELVIIDDSEEAKEALDNIVDKDNYASNTRQRQDIVALLKLNPTKLKTELKKVTADSEKRFILDVAKEENIDSATTRKILADWSEIPQDILFDDGESQE
ncbi:hypothetical protein [Brevibacillus laterosporus]|uniref:Uncharacterized protein n=1 Tax=Brevibacillus laterosporus TaxID=1465 RepID=A0AAP8U722_BRELA|nr:hypothetical protein [Brevibacillus laterosporus]MBG9776194.1 hypothetical protein [Brevibacillus laterosporus]PPB12838.1 hypothetical protein C4A77_00190 [Brevibacillus laterosporus]